MVTEILIPDAEVIARQWVKNVIPELVGANVSSKLPADPPFPFITVQLVRTVRSSGEAKLWESWLQIDAYAGRNEFGEASKVIRTLVTIADEWTGVVTPTLTESAYLYGIRLENLRRLPEPETEWARYMADMSFMMRKE